MTEKDRPLFNLGTEELRDHANTALDSLAEVLWEALQRRRARGRKLFDELRSRRPPAGTLDAPEAQREHSVYVIELDPAVLENRGFKRANPDYVEGKACLYVGMTFHSPEKRFRQHLAGENDGKYVKENGRRLRRDLFEGRNPLTRREAEIEERALALELRDEGYAVWQN